MRAGRHAKADFGFEPPAPSGRVDRQLDDQGLPERHDIRTAGWSRFAGRIRVTLDGAEATSRCVAFDCVKGTLTRQRLDDAGRIFVDPETDKVAVEQLTGTVRVAWR